MTEVEYRVEGKIAYITLNRPEVLNALTDDTVIELRDMLYRFDDDPDAWAAILSGNGRAFCSGADVRKRLMRPREEQERLGGGQGRGSHLDELWYRHTNWKPVIAAVHGFATGAGLYFSMMADMLVAAEGTKFQISETKRGWSATNFTAILTHLSNGRFANDVTMTGRFFDAEEAHSRGLVDRLAPAGQHIAVARMLIEDEILVNPPLVVRAAVEARRGVLEQIEVTGRLMQNRNLHLTEDYREGSLAFAEKRSPIFHAR